MRPRLNPLLKSLLMKIPAVRGHFKRVEALTAERDYLKWKLDTLAREAAPDASLLERPEDGWKESKTRKRKLSEEFRRDRDFDAHDVHRRASRESSRSPDCRMDPPSGGSGAFLVSKNRGPALSLQP